MEDKEIIKALECCAKGFCSECPNSNSSVNVLMCQGILTSDALDLINRQQAEIERLQNLTEKDFEQTAISTVKRHQKWIEYRAIKEFAERLKSAFCPMCDYGKFEIDIAIDNLVKEMVGDAE